MKCQNSREKEKMLEKWREKICFYTKILNGTGNEKAMEQYLPNVKEKMIFNLEVFPTAII